MAGKAPTLRALQDAVEGGDVFGLKALYAQDAVITIIDSRNTPSNPKVLTGAVEIGAFLDDVYSRDMTHRVETAVMDGTKLAFLESCRYSDGTRVAASNLAEIGPEGIVRQTVVQAWDG